MARELDPMAVALEVMDRPWQWGVADCCTAACDVFHRLHGIDPMAPLRGTYSSRLGAVRAIRARGGWLSMAEGLAAEAGLVVSDGAPGEIGLTKWHGGAALVVHVGSGWAGKTERGMQTVETVVRCWRA